jgi:hypothetical protein
MSWRFITWFNAFSFLLNQRDPIQQYCILNVSKNITNFLLCNSFSISTINNVLHEKFKEKTEIIFCQKKTKNWFRTRMLYPHTHPHTHTHTHPYTHTQTQTHT